MLMESTLDPDMWCLERLFMGAEVLNRACRIVGVLDEVCLMKTPTMK